MKTIFRKIVALICVMALCVGMIPATASAVDSYTGKLTIAGAVMDGVIQANADRTVIYLKGTDTYLTGADNWKADVTMMPVEGDTESGIYVNGTRVSTYYTAGQNQTAVRFRKISDSENCYYIEGLTGVEKGSVVVVRGKFHVYGSWWNGSNVDCDYGKDVTFEESTFVWNGIQWIDCHKGQLSITGAANINNINTGNFYIKGTDTYQTGTGTAWAEGGYIPVNDESGVKLNGTKFGTYLRTDGTGIRFRKYDDASNYYISGITGVSTNDVLTIEGTFYVYSDDNTSSSPRAAVTIEKSEFQWNGSKWVNYYATTPGLTEANTSLSDFQMYGTDTYKTGHGSLGEPGWPDSTFTPYDDGESGVYVDTVRINDYYRATENASANGYIRLRKINDTTNEYRIENIPGISTGSVVTIKGDFYAASNAWEPYNTLDIVHFDEVSFQWNGSAWVEYEPFAVYSGSLTREGAEQNDAHEGAIYLKGNDQYLSTDSSENWESSAAQLSDAETDVTSGIFINDVKQENGLLIKYNGVGNSYYVKGFSTKPTTSDVVKIVGTFYSADGLASVTFTKSEFKWDGDKWVNYYATTLGLTEANTSLSDFQMYGTDTYKTGHGSLGEPGWPDSTFTPYDGDENGVYVDGIKVNDYYKATSDASADGYIRLRKINDTTNEYRIENLSKISTGSVVTIKGDFYAASNAWEPHNTLNTVHFDEVSFQWNGNAWVDYVKPTEYDTKLTEEAGQVVSTSSKGIYLGSTDADTWLSGNGEKWNVAYLTADSSDPDSGVWLGDKKIDEAQLQKYWGAKNHYYLDNFGTANIGDIITIKGDFYSSDRLTRIHFEKTQIQFFGNRWLDRDKIKELKDGTIWLDTNETSTSTNLYLRGSVDVHEDCAPSEDVYFGWTTGIGTVGFWKNGVACTGTMKNTTNGGGWYADLGEADIQVGDKLTIQGIFGYEGSYVLLEEYNLWYTSDGWKITAPATTETYGDSNGDAVVNSIDIVRLKRYLADEPVYVSSADTSGNKTGADANAVDGVNDRDRIKIYELILEGALYTVDSDGYAIDHYPVYLDDEDIKLGAYHGPRMSGQQDYTYDGSKLTSVKNTNNFMTTAEFAKYKAAGLNTLLHEVDGAYSSQSTGLGYGVTDGNLITYFQLAKEAGLDVYITSMGLNSYVRSAVSGAGATSGDLNEDGIVSSSEVTIDEKIKGWDYNGDGTIGTATMSEVFYYSDKIKNEEGKTILEADIEEILDFIVTNGYKDIFKGFMMPDEPYYVCNGRYASAVALIQAECAERGLSVEFQGCLYPSNAEEEAIGSDYTSYLNAFGTVAGSLMYDSYPLQNTKKSWSSNWSNTLNSAWLTNLQTVATQGKNNNYKTGITLQSCGYEFGAEAGFFQSQSYRRDPSSDADMQFQVYSALAFGMKTINYFTYWEHPTQSKDGEWFTSSMVQYPADGGTESVTTNVYNYVKNANAEISKFDHVFMDYDWVETKANGSSGLFSGLTSTDISGVTVNSYSKASIISHMHDDEKNLDGYWLVNVEEPSGSTTATLNVTFSGKNKAIVFIDGEQKIIDLDNEAYQAELKVGEGIFIIPLEISE